MAEPRHDSAGPTTLAGFLRDGFDRHGDRPAVSCVLPNGMSSTLSYRRLDRLSDAVAHWLRLEMGLTPGDVVAIKAPNCLAAVIVVYGAIKAGIVPTLINPLYTPREVEEQLIASGARAFFVLDVLATDLATILARVGQIPVVTLSLADGFDLLRSLFIDIILRWVRKQIPTPDVVSITLSRVIQIGTALGRSADSRSYLETLTADDVASCMFTGGTTGRSKGVIHTNGSIVANIATTRLALAPPGSLEPERTLLVLPLYHIFGTGMLLNSHAGGGHVILVPNPRPLSNLRSALLRFRPDFLPGVPTLFNALLVETWFVSLARGIIRRCICGAAPLPPSTATRWQEIVGAPIQEIYGMTEWGLASATAVDAPNGTGTIGRLLPGIDARLLDQEGQEVPAGTPGELVLRGRQMMHGYLNAPELTAQAIVDGWLRTGDICVREPDGSLRVVDRIKDMILVSGFNVYPNEVENVLTEHPGVHEVAVIGRPDIRTGESVVAYVVPSSAELTLHELDAHCRTRLAGYKVPRRIELVSSLPKSPVGKILKRELRTQMIAAETRTS